MKVSKSSPCPGSDNGPDKDSGKASGKGTDKGSDKDSGKGSGIPAESLPPWAQRAQNHLCQLYSLLLKLRGKKAYGAPYKYLGKGIEMPRSKRDRAVSIAVLAIILHDLWIYLATRG